MRHYTGVGSRSCPVELQQLLKTTSSYLEGLGFILRSGGAAGADHAFESGVKKYGNKEIYYATDATVQAMDIARQVHPNWEACNALARSLHARNVLQVLGKDLKSPSEFLICWTPEGKAIGGTRTAIMVATDNGISIYNLGNKAVLPVLDEFLNTLKSGIRKIGR